MPTSNWARIVIALAALIAGGFALALGANIDIKLVRAVVPTSSVVILFLLAFDRWLWRWPGIQRLMKRPVLHGTWKTELRTTYKDRADEAIEAYLVVVQTYSRICVRMLFDRSQSKSMSGDLVQENGHCVLCYVFRSEKHALEPKSNPPSRGAAQLAVATKPSTHLEGDYWMEVGTKGRLVSKGHSPTRFDTFAGARRGTYR